MQVVIFFCNTLHRKWVAYGMMTSCPTKPSREFCVSCCRQQSHRLAITSVNSSRNRYPFVFWQFAGKFLSAVECFQYWLDVDLGYVCRVYRLLIKQTLFTFCNWPCRLWHVVTAWMLRIVRLITLLITVLRCVSQYHTRSRTLPIYDQPSAVLWRINLSHISRLTMRGATW